uniref:TPM_phosphatase domain-containing protein n=1 Tax=Caenorhabditis tropicalis TaxID=1561998 RepID=A0A1I7UYX5_9PELO
MCKTSILSLLVTVYGPLRILRRVIVMFVILFIGMFTAAPSPSQTDLKRIFREIAANENAYGVIQVVPYSERLPAYMVISNKW